MLPTHRMGVCSHLPLTGFGFCSFLESDPPSQLTKGQASLPELCKLQTVLPSTGHIALSGEQMFQHLSRCLSAASHHLLVLVPRRPQATSTGTPCHDLYMPGSVPPVGIEGQEHRISVSIMIQKHDALCASTSPPQREKE